MSLKVNMMGALNGDLGGVVGHSHRRRVMGTEATRTITRIIRAAAGMMTMTVICGESWPTTRFASCKGERRHDEATPYYFDAFSA